MAETFVNVTEGSGKKLHTFDRTVGANSVHDEIMLNGLPYLATYTATASAISTATAASHLITINAGGSLNVYITRIKVLQSTACTTAAFARIHLLRTTTAAPTGGTAITPAGHDTGDSASGASAMSLPTVKATESTTLYLGAGYFVQTVATAGGNNTIFDWHYDTQRGKPIRIAAGTTNGIALKMVDAVAAGAVQINVEFFEASFT